MNPVRNFPFWLAPAALVSISQAAEPPAAFQGLFEAGVPVRAQIGTVMLPQALDELVAKVDVAAQANPEWFEEYSAENKPGLPLPFHENLGLSAAEYQEYLRLWRMREFRPEEDVVILIRESSRGTWALTGTNRASVLSTLRYDPETDSFRSPNGELERLEDIDAEEDSILGAWKGREWRLQQEGLLGVTRENIAIGTMAGDRYGLLIHRVQEVSTEGALIINRSLVIRFPLGEAGRIRVPAP